MEVQGGILSGPEIHHQVALGKIVIDPFEPEHVNPASVDLTLGREVKYYHLPASGSGLHIHDAHLDPKQENSVTTVEFPDEGHIIRPGQLYLMHTVEVVSTTKYVPVLDGKSSIGRLGIQVHVTAGYGDPGYNGQYTLEVTCVHPVKLYPGMRIAQMRFHTMVGELQRYEGSYTDGASKGAVPSKSFKQFREKK